MKTFPKNIIFDFGGVLLDIDIPLTVKAFEQLQINIPNPADIHPNNAGIFLALEKGEASIPEFVEYLQKYSSQEPKPTEQEILAAWNALLLPFEWKNFEFLDKLRAKGHNVYLLSNTNEPHHIYFETEFEKQHPTHRTLPDHFDRIFYSDRMEMRKPDMIIYQTVQEAIQAAPHEILFIDDNAPNLTAPSTLGWHTHHLAKPQTIHQLFENYV